VDQRKPLQFGSLRANGVAVQLRFQPCPNVVGADVDVGVGNSEESESESAGTGTGGGEGSGGQPATPPPRPRCSYRLMDGAFTADPRAADGRQGPPQRERAQSKHLLKTSQRAQLKKNNDGW